MNGEEALVTAGLVVCIGMTAVLSALLLVDFTGMDRYSPIQYYEADRAEPSANGYFGAPVFNLTEDGFADHPVFNELFLHRKKVLYSLKPGHVIPIIQANFRTYSDGGKAYALAILPGEENAYLTQLDMHVVSFRGQYYYIRKEGARPIRPCGNGTQC